MKRKQIKKVAKVNTKKEINKVAKKEKQREVKKVYGWDAIKNVIAEDTVKTDKCEVLLKTAREGEKDYRVYMQVLQMDERFRNCVGKRTHYKSSILYRSGFVYIDSAVYPEFDTDDDIVYLRGSDRKHDMVIVKTYRRFRKAHDAIDWMNVVVKALKEWSEKWEGWKDIKEVKKEEASPSELQIPKELNGDWYTEYPIGGGGGNRVGARVLTHRNKVFFRVTESSVGFDVFLQVWNMAKDNEFIRCATGFPTLAGAVNYIRNVALIIRRRGEEWDGFIKYSKPVEEVKPVKKTTDVGDLMILVGKIKTARKKLDEVKERVNIAIDEQKVVCLEMNALLKDYEKIGKELSGIYIS